MVPCIELKNEAKTIVVGGKLRRTQNKVVNDWDLIGYEIHGNPTEIIGPSGITGRAADGIGYICDESGVTVSFERSGPKPEVQPADGDLIFGKAELIGYKLNAETVPFILISNNGITVTWGGYIRRKGKVLTDGPGLPAYKIMSDAVEIINLSTGKNGMGYICDEAGVTVTIGREISVKYPLEMIKKNPELEKVEVKIKFSGVIGILATFDRIPEIFNVGQSRKNFWMGIAAGLFIMFVIRLVF